MPIGKTGHPLPSSEEARHGEIPETLEEKKGGGDDAKKAFIPGEEGVTPDGEPYRYDDLGRGPTSQNDERVQGSVGKFGKESDDPVTDELKRDQKEHRDRGQSKTKEMGSSARGASIG